MLEGQDFVDNMTLMVRVYIEGIAEGQDPKSLALSPNPETKSQT